MNTARETRTRSAWLVALLLLGAILSLQYALRYFANDDEGGYLYASWRVSEGEVPYRDFLTPRMPAFLYWGGLIVRVFGRSHIAPRLATILLVLLAAYLLYALNRELYGPLVALLSMALFLVEGNTVEVARMFRPEALMLLFSNAGLYAFVLGEKRGRRAYVWLAGVLFGLAILSKLFGALPLLGCFLYLLYAWARERRAFRNVLGEGLALGVPALLLVGGVAVVFTRTTPYFLAAVFEHHTLQGVDLSRWQTVVKALDLYRVYIVSQPVATGLIVLGGTAVLRRRSALEALALWQVPTVLAFTVLTRPLFPRHMTYLSPALATLAALTLWLLLGGNWRVWDPRSALAKGRAARYWGVATLAVGLAAVYPWARANWRLVPEADRGSFALAALIDGLTAPGEFVIAPSPEINFLAGRRTTYWAAGLSGGATRSGQIRGEMLVAEMEEDQVAMVIIDPLNHHFRDLTGFPSLWHYVQSHYSLVDKPSREGRFLDIYAREDTMPFRLGISFGDALALTGARLAQTEVRSGDPLGLFLRWRGLQGMASDYQVSLRLMDGDAMQWAEAVDVPSEWIGHLSLPWEPGTVELQEYSLKVPLGTPPGSYFLTTQVADPDSGQILRPAAAEQPAWATEEAVIAPVRVLPASVPPQPDSIPMAVMLRADLAPDLELLGSRSLPNGIAAGRALVLTLFWHAPARPSQDYRLEFRLAQGERIVQRWPREIAAKHPPSAWRDGEVVLGRYRLPLNDALLEGRYDLRVAVIGQDALVAGETKVIADLAVRARLDADAIAKAIQHPLSGLTFDGRIELLGYDLSTEALNSGQPLYLTLYWLCQQPVRTSYTVFTHLLDSASTIRGQRDAAPRQGSAPTSEWAVGDVVVDPYEIPLEAGVASETLRLEVGLYNPLTGERLPLFQDGQETGQDHLILPTAITVRP